MVKRGIIFRGGAWRDMRGYFVSRKRVKRAGKTWRRKEVKVPSVKVRPPKPVAPKFMWRLTIAINFVTHHRYYALRLQRWANTLEELKMLERESEEKLITNLEARLGFSRENWWFPYQVGTGYQPVVYNSSLIDREEIALEFLRVKRR